MRRWIALSSFTFVLASSTAHAITANPTVQISNDGPIDSFTNLPQLVELYDVGCSENGTGVTYVWQGIDLFRASDGTQIGGEGGLGYGDGSGPPNGTALAGPLAGVKVVARFEDVSCSKGTESAPAQTVSSNEIIIPPTMTMSSVVGSNDDGTISVGQAVRFNPVVGCNLAPSETITFSISGPGISFTKAYADWTDFRADPDAMVTANAPGQITIEATFMPYGLSAPILTYEVVAAGTSGGTSGASSTGASSGTSGSGGSSGTSSTKKGCGADVTGDPAGLGALLLALLALRRARR
ncbi:MAG: hypothetical protein JST54_33880 [Deltaproteobacteria bacterium]|nr:hypothetical protein [Deltaproteobacteria bacterium]